MLQRVIWVGVGTLLLTLVAVSSLWAQPETFDVICLDAQEDAAEASAVAFTTVAEDEGSVTFSYTALVNVSLLDDGEIFCLVEAGGDGQSSFVTQLTADSIGGDGLINAAEQAAVEISGTVVLEFGAGLALFIDQFAWIEAIQDTESPQIVSLFSPDVIEGGTTNQQTVPIDALIEETDALGNPGTGIAFVLCQLDGGAFQPCSVPAFFTVTDEGEHSVAMFASDGAGNAGAASIFQWTLIFPGPSVEDFAADVTLGEIPLRVTFSAQISDPDDPELLVIFTAGDGSPPEIRFESNLPGATLQLTFEHEYTQIGIFLATLLVTDGPVGLPSTEVSEATVQIETVNDTPKLSILLSDTAPGPGETITLQVDVTDHTDAHPRVDVDWGDGETSSGIPQSPITFEHRYKLSQQFTIHVSATDGDGITGRASATVTVRGLESATVREIIPSCLPPGQGIIVTVRGEGFDVQLVGTEVVIIGRRLTIVAASSTSIMIEIPPDLPEGVPGIFIDGLGQIGQIEINDACGTPEPTDEEIDAGLTFLQGPWHLFGENRAQLESVIERVSQQFQDVLQGTQLKDQFFDSIPGYAMVRTEADITLTLEEYLRIHDAFNAEPGINSIPNLLQDLTQVNDPNFPQQQQLQLLNILEGWQRYVLQRGEGTTAFRERE
jgi:hypothetical protein